MSLIDSPKPLTTHLDTLHLDRASAVPLYKQLLNGINSHIASGLWVAGTQLPTEAEFASALDISRVTVRQAFQIAADEGIVVRVPGKGTFVASVERTKRRQGFIGYVVPHLSHSFNVQIMLGAESVFKAAGYQMIFCNSEADLEEENHLLLNLEQEGMAGYAIQPLFGGGRERVLRTLIAKKYPIVLIDRFTADLETDSVTSDHFGGGHSLVRHLIAEGYRQIVYLARPPLDLSSIAERYQAYQHAMHEAELTPLPPFLVGSLTELGYIQNLAAFTAREAATIQTISDYLRSPQRPEAIVAMNDLHALLTLTAAQQVGLRVPDDLAVVGFDDLDFAPTLTPPLTTVAQQPFVLGAEAATLLLSKVNGTSSSSLVNRLRVPTQLVIRSSSRTLPHR